MCKHILINNFDKKTDIDIIKSFNEKTYDKDGYGAIIRTVNNNITTLKSLDKTIFYIDLMNLLHNTDEKIASLVIHHRTSTNKSGIEYAHPFEYNGHLMTHNGVVSVPNEDALKTKTSNDSEKLLHHLVSGNFTNTKEVEGYFSVFVINNNHTMMLVDSTAPMYTDQRIYCSHNLDESKFTKLTNTKHIINPKTGKLIESSTIEISDNKSGYGLNKAHLSLGKGQFYNNYYDYYGYNYGYDYSDDLPPSYRNVVDAFWKNVNSDDLEYILSYENDAKERRIAIKDIASIHNLKLSKSDIKEIDLELVDEYIIGNSVQGYNYTDDDNYKNDYALTKGRKSKWK